MNQKWNQWIYKKWAPVYDLFFHSFFFQQARAAVFGDVVTQSGQSILFVGAGTGADISWAKQRGLRITAIDLSPDMLGKARAKFPDGGVEFIEMDAQHLAFADDTFDFVAASLVLSVVPDGNQCLSEMARVLKSGGTLIVFDKFAPKSKPLPLVKKAVRPLIQLLGTDIGRSFEAMYAASPHPMHIQTDTPVLFGGMYRKILLEKQP